MRFEQYPVINEGQLLIVPNGWTPGRWQHIAAVINATSNTTATMSIFIDGVQQAIKTDATPPPSRLRRLSWIGRSNWVNDPAMNGTLDSWYYFNYALETSQIAMIINLLNPASFDASWDSNPAAMLPAGQTPSYGWSAVSNTDSSHPGELTFNGNSQFVDLYSGSGNRSIN